VGELRGLDFLIYKHQQEGEWSRYERLEDGKTNLDKTGLENFIAE